MMKKTQAIARCNLHLAGLCACCMAVATAQAGIPTYTEVSAGAGITMQAEVNNMGAGIAWIDYNNDGFQDLFVPSVAAPNRLYSNNGDGTFTEVAASANVQLNGVPSVAAVTGDYDGDGYDDLFVVNSGSNTLLRNKGDGTFEDVTAVAHLDDVSSGANAGAASFGDVDRDGDIDLQVGKWYVGGTPVNCPTAIFYLNNGDGTFTNKTIEAGLADAGCSFDVPMTDYDGDGDLDILEVNDTVAGNFPFPAVYRNDGVDLNGVPQFTKVDTGLFSGLFTGMGIAIGDYDNDSKMDYYTPQIGIGVLSTNTGNGGFTTSSISGDGATGWGAVFMDADKDGFLDIYRANCGVGPGCGAADLTINAFFENNGNGTFTRDIDNISGLEIADSALGLAKADYDNDGDIDIAVHALDGRLSLLRNDTVNANNWVELRLDGQAGNHRAIGARVTLETSNGVNTRTQIREVGAGSGHGSTQAFPVLFGLGDHDRISKLSVVWPLGCEQVYKNITINQINNLPEPVCHTLSGTVTNTTGNVVQGLQVQINNNSGMTVTVTSDQNGQFKRIVPDDVYVVLGVASSTYSVSCGFAFVSVSGSDVTKNCSATLITHKISGTVLDPSGQPVPGAKVQVANNSGFSTILATDLSGKYSVGVPDGTYVVLGVQTSGYTNNCGFAFVSVAGADVAKNCTATPSGPVITGAVWDENGQPMPGAQIQINNNSGFAAIATANVNGIYNQVVADGQYVVYALPFATHTINCGFIFVSVAGADVTKNCTGSPL